VLTATDLSALSVDELVKAFVETILFRKTIEHVGRSNRSTTQIWRMGVELKARDPALNCLRGFLNHPEREVRFSTAVHFKNIDRAVFREIVTELAKGDGMVGFEARMSLDELLKGEKAGKDTHGDPVFNPELYSPSAESAWQVRHPPPPAMSLVQIRRRVAGKISPAFAGHVLSFAKPAIGLWPQQPRTELSITASRLGGMPHAPAGWSWPLCETEPMFFLGQVNCAELQGLSGAEKLPSSGLLAFFADHDAVNCAPPYEDKGFAVYHWTELDQLVPAKPPIELQQILPLCRLASRPMVDLPDICSATIDALEWSEDDRDAYFDLVGEMRDYGVPESSWDRISRSKLFGYPHWVQNEPEQMGGPNDPNGLQLLLQLDSYTDGKKWAEWGDAGTLYFLIRDADLAARRFDRCEFEAQCGRPSPLAHSPGCRRLDSPLSTGGMRSAEMKARVTVTLKSGILDPQGKAIEGALTSLGIAGVASVRQGKVFDIEIADGDRAAAETRLKEAAEKLLANTVIENYRVEIT
jgi:phosphoribosylformylglycinamidine synthase PurS subunit